MPPAISYRMTLCKRVDVLGLFAAFHAYKSVGRAVTYGFAVWEPSTLGNSDQPVAAYIWSPPPRGAALSLCPEAPQGVLALSRMVAIPKDERALNHISKPLRRQMRIEIDRTRWPVLVTYSDEGLGHSGHVYKCSGWTPTVKAKRPYYVDEHGRRCSSYSNGKSGGRKLQRAGTTTIQRWEHWACPRDNAAQWMLYHGWRRVPILGKTWASGNQAHRYVRLDDHDRDVAVAPDDGAERPADRGE